MPTDRLLFPLLLIISSINYRQLQIQQQLGPFRLFFLICSLSAIIPAHHPPFTTAINLFMANDESKSGCNHPVEQVYQPKCHTMRVLLLKQSTLRQQISHLAIICQESDPFLRWQHQQLLRIRFDPKSKRHPVPYNPTSSGQTGAWSHVTCLELFVLTFFGTNRAEIPATSRYFKGRPTLLLSTTCNSGPTQLARSTATLYSFDSERSFGHLIYLSTSANFGILPAMNI